MYRPGMGVDPWYENFKFFLTYWLLSSNNRDRMGDVDQLPPLPPNGAPAPPFMSPQPQKSSGHDQQNNQQQGQGHQQQNQNSSTNPSSKSPNSVAPTTSGPNPSQISWETLDKHVSHHGGSVSPRLGQNANGNHGNHGIPPLPDGFPGSLSSFKQAMSSHNTHDLLSGNHGGAGHHISHHGNPGGNGMLPEHIILDKDRRHVCPHCYKGFRSRQQLNQHNLVHSGVRKYHCMYCERAFKQLSHLQQHHRIHTGEKPYRCPLDGCDKAFAQMSNLQHHMRQHDKATFGQKQCMCPFCDRGYASEKSLKSHLSKMHPDSKLFGLGGQRSNLPLMDGQSHSMLGSPQSGVGLGHHNGLPIMHPGMKSPLTPPGGPLELTVNSHQRNAMPADSRKYSIDSSKPFSMGNNLSPHEAKMFQRSLSERLPDRACHDKLDSMLDQRFGFQNHFRDMNRFSDRSFEPFSPSRLHEVVRSFDFKEIEAKLFDPSLSSEKFQRMAENFNEFRSRFQDQILRREGTRQGAFPFEGRNMIQEMNERNAFFNSRTENNDFVSASNRDRYNEANRNFNAMNINDVDNFAANRNDMLRLRGRSEMGSRNNMNSPDYNRGRESVSDGHNSMGIDGNIDIRRHSLNLDQNLNVRNSSTNSDVLLQQRSADLASGHDTTTLSSNQRQAVMSSAENDLMTMRPGQRNGIVARPGMDSHNSGIDGRTAMDTQSTMDSRNTMDTLEAHNRLDGSRIDAHNRMESRNSMDGRNRMETSSDIEMLALRGARGNLDMENLASMRLMSAAAGHLDPGRQDLRNNIGRLMSPNGNMIIGGSGAGNRNENTGAASLDMVEQRVDRNMEQHDRGGGGYDGRLQNSEQQSRADYDMMERNSMSLGQDKDKMTASDDMVVDRNMNIGNIGDRDPTDAMQLQNHSRNMGAAMSAAGLSVRNELDTSSYSDKQRDLHSRSREMMLTDDLGRLATPQVSSAGGHHAATKQNSHERMLQDNEMDFGNRGENKTSTQNHLSDPNMIRQRKQRKPSNPQHVQFMPSLDHYASFAVDEVEEVGALM